MTIILSGSYNDLEDTLSHFKSLKLKSYAGQDVVYWCDSILLDAEHLESDRDFKLNHFNYSTHIFEYTSGSNFFLQAIQKYKKVTEFIKKPCMFDLDVIQPEELINYKSLV